MAQPKCNDWWRPKRIAVRASVYRGTEGFSVRGGRQGPHIFVKTRKGAETIRDAYKNCKLSREMVWKITDDVFDRERSR